jgi:hypothetical protein
MIRQARGVLVRAIGVVAVGSILLVVPAFAQDAASSPEYGQGAGVTRARTLPRTGDGAAVATSADQLLVDGSLLLLLGGAAGIVVGVSGGMVIARRDPVRRKLA